MRSISLFLIDVISVLLVSMVTKLDLAWGLERGVLWPITELGELSTDFLTKFLVYYWKPLSYMTLIMICLEIILLRVKKCTTVYT